MLLLVPLTQKPIEIPAPQMYRSCTENFGGHRLLTRSHFHHSVNALGRTYSAEHSFAMTSGWPTILELMAISPFLGTNPPELAVG